MASGRAGATRAFAGALLGLALLVVVVLAVALAGSSPEPVSAASGPEVLALLTGTALSCAIAIVVAAPLGVLAAIHLSEFASRRGRARLSFLLELVALVPTVVWGVFALAVVTPSLRALIPGLAGQNALSAGLVLGVMITPMIAARASAALIAVPPRLREGALALGAGETQTILTIVIPAAAPGIAAAILLALSRALGEAMIVSLAAGHRPTLTLDPRVPIETLSAHILGSARAGAVDHRELFAVGLGLLALAVISSLAARKVARWRSEEAWA